MEIITSWARCLLNNSYVEMRSRGAEMQNDQATKSNSTRKIRPQPLRTKTFNFGQVPSAESHLISRPCARAALSFIFYLCYNNTRDSSHIDLRFTPFRPVGETQLLLLTPRFFLYQEFQIPAKDDQICRTPFILFLTSRVTCFFLAAANILKIEAAVDLTV